MNDTLVEGAWAGLVGSLFGDQLIHIIAHLTLHTSMTLNYIASLIFHLKNEESFLPLFVAFLVHAAAGAFVGMCLALIFKYFGEDYGYVKGLGLGITMWIIHIVIIPNIISFPLQYVVRTPLETVIDLGGHLSYAVLTATVLLKKPSIKSASPS